MGRAPLAATPSLEVMLHLAVVVAPATQAGKAATMAATALALCSGLQAMFPVLVTQHRLAAGQQVQQRTGPEVHQRTVQPMDTQVVQSWAAVVVAAHETAHLEMLALRYPVVRVVLLRCPAPHQTVQHRAAAVAVHTTEHLGTVVMEWFV
jgi:hypothetical protein